MMLNPNVNVNTTEYENADVFTPDDGYALWDDTEEGNLDENGSPLCYWLTMIIPKRFFESFAPHLWARLIEPGMEVYGDVAPPAETMAEVKEKAEAYDILMGESE